MRTDRSGCPRRFARDVQHILVNGMSPARRLGAGCCNLTDRSSYSLVEIYWYQYQYIYTVFVLRLLLCHVMTCYVYNCHFAKFIFIITFSTIYLFISTAIYLFHLLNYLSLSPPGE